MHVCAYDRAAIEVIDARAHMLYNGYNIYCLTNYIYTCACVYILCCDSLVRRLYKLCSALWYTVTLFTGMLYIVCPTSEFLSSHVTEQLICRIIL